MRIDDDAFPDDESPKSRSKKSTGADVVPVVPLAQHNENGAQPPAAPAMAKPVVDAAAAEAAAPLPRAPSPVASEAAAMDATASPAAEATAPSAAPSPKESEADAVQPLIDAAKAKVEAMCYKELQKELKVGCAAAF